MSPNKYLFCLCMFVACASAFAQESQCKNVNLELKISPTTNGLNNGEIRITAPAPIDPVIHLISRDPKKSRYNHKSLTISTLSKGDYDVLITDYKDRVCPTHKKVTIE